MMESKRQRVIDTRVNLGWEVQIDARASRNCELDSPSSYTFEGRKMCVERKRHRLDGVLGSLRISRIMDNTNQRALHVRQIGWEVHSGARASIDCELDSPLGLQALRSHRRLYRNVDYTSRMRAVGIPLRRKRPSRHQACPGRDPSKVALVRHTIVNIPEERLSGKRKVVASCVGEYTRRLFRTLAWKIG